MRVDQHSLDTAITYSLAGSAAIIRQGTVADIVSEINRCLTNTQLDEAEHLLLQLIQALPKDLQPKLQLAEVCLQLGYPDRTRRLADEVLSIDNFSVSAMMLKADSFFRLDRGADAVALAQQLVNLQPRNPVYRNNLGVYQMGIGRFQDATTSFLSAIELDESYAAPIHNLTSLPEVEITNDQLISMQLLANKPSLSDEDKAIIDFCISKFHRQHGNAVEEFNYLERAHEIFATISPWDGASFGSIVETIEATNPEGLSRFQESGRTRLSGIFISSMPRSGSTLLDQTISAHPDILSLGESGLATRAVRHAAAIKHLPIDSLWTWVKRPDSQNLFSSLFDEWESTLENFQLSSPWFSEKSINNDVFLGVCLLANPNNKVIHCQRNPLDVCLSTYQTFFAKGIDFSHKLSWAAKRYEFHKRLMAHWTEVFPDRIIKVDYEALVTDPRPTIERVLEFLSLPWSEACLQFHETGRNVRSASNWQVRQPLYRTAVGRWRRYERQLSSIMHLHEDDCWDDDSASEGAS